MTQRAWSPERLVGERVLLRRHVPANLATFQRWYSDPEVARLTRYQDGPMRPEEIERIVVQNPDIREACTKLIARANEQGGEDNVTAVLIKIEEQVDAPTEIPAARQR